MRLHDIIAKAFQTAGQKASATDIEYLASVIAYEWKVPDVPWHDPRQKRLNKLLTEAKNLIVNELIPHYKEWAQRDGEDWWHEYLRFCREVNALIESYLHRIEFERRIQPSSEQADFKKVRAPDRIGDRDEWLMRQLIRVGGGSYESRMLVAAALISLAMKRPNRTAATKLEIDEECRRIRRSCERRGLILNEAQG
jgi:hypothetical protein